MGNEKSSHKPPAAPEPLRNDPRVEKAFQRLTEGKPLTFQSLKDAFNEDLAESLWDFLSEKKSRDQQLSLLDFGKNAKSLLGECANIYASICQPERHLIKICSEAAGAIAVTGDEHFIAALEHDLITKSSTSVDIDTWVNLYAPRFCQSVQSVVQSKLLGYDLVTYDYASDILSPLEMWFLKCSLPPIFIPDKSVSEISCQWTPLYTSAMQGISVNRFDTNVVDYRGPTVMILQLTDKRKIALASDQEWRHSALRFGGPSTTYLQFFPTIQRVQNASSSIYCNFKVRSASFGLSFKEILKIDKDMSNVQAIEVWGCAGATTLADQQRLKSWQSQQAEKNKKVPLPGNWDDNPDKTLLEMGGFQFSNERKLMEMEGHH